VRCGNGQASRELPPLELFWDEDAPTADIALCPAAQLGSYSPRVTRLGSTSIARERPVVRPRVGWAIADGGLLRDGRVAHPGSGSPRRASARAWRCRWTSRARRLHLSDQTTEQ